MSVYANVATTPARRILAYQKRPLSDALFPEITNPVTTHSGVFWFVLSAENYDGPSDGDTIRGSVHLFKSTADWKSVHHETDAAIRNLNILRLSTENTRDTQVASVSDEIKQVLINRADITASFELKRSGEVYFSEPDFLNVEVLTASLDHAATQGQDFLKWIADQAYFFLRDMIHQHQHHDLSEDTILVLQPADAKDVEWRKKVIYSLYFRIIRAKRSEHYPHATRAMGILAYCQSFKKISAEAFKEAKQDLPFFNDKSLRRSLKAKIQEDTALYQKDGADALDRATRSMNFRMIALTIVLIILGTFAVFAESVSKYPPNREFGERLVLVLIPFIKLMLIGMVVVWTISSDIVLKWQSVLELSNVHRLRAATIYFAIAAGIFIGLGGYAVWPVIEEMAEKLSLPLEHRSDNDPGEPTQKQIFIPPKGEKVAPIINPPSKTTHHRHRHKKLGVSTTGASLTEHP